MEESFGYNRRQVDLHSSAVPSSLHEEASCDLEGDTKKDVRHLFPCSRWLPGLSFCWSASMELKLSLAAIPLTHLSAIEYLFHLTFSPLPRPHCLWNFSKCFQCWHTRLKPLVLASDIRLWLCPICCVTSSDFTNPLRHMLLCPFAM